ncbi:MAG TPA: TIGR03564 family F420-dependent LLM class oxidoreductase [Streptosporangiaceae bacterium]|nr:TIGR03564 family F420-dependent LLM class oxidoreductase [Streptosporangiaceae bacterium]
MRIGVSLPDATGPDALGTVRLELRRAADDGFLSAWMNNIFGLDALTTLAVTGGAGPGIELGTAVVPTYPRHPAALAQQALTTAAATGGRLTLGVGPSHQILIEDMFGYRFDKPVQHTREYLSILRPLLHGQPAAFTGQQLSAHITLTTPAPGPVPLLLAALGPAMLRAAGQLADGTVLWMTGPATVREHIVPTITAAAEAAGRPSPRVVCILPVCVTSDPGAARAEAATVFAIYGQLPSYRAMLDREGAAGPEDVALVGDEAAVAAQLGTLAEAGVTDFVAGVYGRGEDAARTREFLRTQLS